MNWCINRYFVVAGISLCCLAADATNSAICASLRDATRTQQRFAIAQIIPDTAVDRNLGTTVLPLTPQIDAITGGTRPQNGINLFHSFSEFSVLEERTVFFANPAGVENILSRVTGNNPSNILGILGVSGNANLFLINPNGISFGQQARLFLGGSFVATTANAVGFGNQGFFSASVPNAPTSLLTVNPSAFLFNQIPRGGIVNNSVAPAGQHPAGFDLFGLRVPDGKSLVLLGGNVSMDGGRLNAVGGRVELGGLAESGTVGLTIDGNNLSLSFPIGVARSDVTLTNLARVDVAGRGGGSVGINAQNLNILQGSRIEAGIEGGLGTIGSKAGNIDIDATGIVNVAGESFISNNVFPNGTGDSGNVNINTQRLIVTDGSQISASTFGQGKAGELRVRASESVELSGDGTFAGGLFAQVNPQATGDGGNLTIETRRLSVSDGSKVQVSTFGQGNAGDLSIHASSVEVFETPKPNFFSTGIFAQVARRTATGAGGNLTIQTENLSIRNGGQVSASTNGVGNAGSLFVQAINSVEVVGISEEFGTRSLLSSNVNRRARGNGGDLTIETGRLILRDGAIISASTFGQGQGGNLNVNATESVKLIGTSLTDSQDRSALAAETFGAGDSGNLKITTGQMVVENGAIVSVGTSPDSTGKSGTLELTATEFVRLTGTSLDGKFRSALSTETNGTGDGGDLQLTTGQLFVQNGAIISAASILGKGRAGKLTVNATDSVELIGTTANGQFPSVLSTETQGGDKPAGDLTINTSRLSIRDGALVTARTFGDGKGGTLTVNADNVELIGTASDGEWISSLTTETQGSGIAGNLRITTGQLTLRDGAQVAVNSIGLESGKAGNLDVTANSILLDNQGKLIAQTESGNGGNITLNLQDLLLMRHNSEISTTAGTANQGGNGGNITINSPFIVAVPKENSDITANAFTGNGGNINITTQGIYGLQFRPRRTPKSDITASSDFGVNGTVLINSDFDVTQSITTLPIDLVDASNQIDQTCTSTGAEKRKNNRFIITGRGGIPPSPNEPLQTELILTPDWVNIDSHEQEQSTDSSTKNRTRTTPVNSTSPLVEAQGWMYGPNGEIILTASAPTATPHSPSVVPDTCPDLKR